MPSRKCLWDCYWESRRSAVGQSYFLSLVTVPEVFAEVNTAALFLQWRTWHARRRRQILCKLSL